MAVPSKSILLGHQNSFFFVATWRPVPASTQGEEDPEAEVPQQRMVLFQRSSLLPEDLGAADQWMVGMGKMVGKCLGSESTLSRHRRLTIRNTLSYSC